MGLQWVMLHIWMSHFTYEWVLWHVKMCSNGSAVSHATYVTSLSHIYEWVVSQMNVLLHVWGSTHTTQPENMLRRVCNESSRVLMSHVTYEWVMLHMNESCYIWMGLHMDEWCYIWISHITWEWVKSHMDESYHMNESFCTCKCAPRVYNR